MLYGREEELGLVNGLLEDARVSRSGALVIRGDPGIGKTALLESAREHATDMTVLAARGVESESQLPFAGLHQLLGPALDLIDRLPDAQAHALEGALGLYEPSSESRFLISAACLTLLAELAEEQPVVCLVDDAQWVDTPSADALLFVSRRLGAEGIVMLSLPGRVRWSGSRLVTCRHSSFGGSTGATLWRCSGLGRQASPRTSRKSWSSVPAATPWP